MDVKGVPTYTPCISSSSQYTLATEKNPQVSVHIPCVYIYPHVLCIMKVQVRSRRRVLSRDGFPIGASQSDHDFVSK